MTEILVTKVGIMPKKGARKRRRGLRPYKEHVASTRDVHQDKQQLKQLDRKGSIDDWVLL